MAERVAVRECENARRSCASLRQRDVSALRASAVGIRSVCPALLLVCVWRKLFSALGFEVRFTILAHDAAG
jgi:hypothetical protein